MYNEDNRLPEVFMAELDLIFQRLSEDDLLYRCLKGITQNQNEAANGILWSKCPKTKFCGARRVGIAACTTIAAFNTSAASQAVTLQLCGVTPDIQTMTCLRNQDATRMRNAEWRKWMKSIEEKAKATRKEKDKLDRESY